MANEQSPGSNSDSIEDPTTDGATDNETSSPRSSDPGEDVGEPGDSETGTSRAHAQLLDLRDAIVEGMRRTLQQDLSEGHAVSQDLGGFGNIQGVGFSEAGAGSGGVPGEPALTLYVAEPTSIEDVRSVVASATENSLAEDADATPINVVVTGIIDADVHRSKMRPAPGGVSAGHYRITAGTIGCFARGRTAPRNNRVLILSNNHVLANSNSAAVNDNILQPGAYDGGQNPGDRIAVLERWQNINFSGGTNYVDCATGWCWHQLVKYPDLMYLAGGRPVYFRVSSTPVSPVRGMAVGKSGRTTQLTRGSITDTSATIRVNYGGGKVAIFADQIAIRAASGNFSAGGDSGSLVWTYDARRNPVALLFAGGGGTTFANKITRVLSALDIVIRS